MKHYITLIGALRLKALCIVLGMLVILITVPYAFYMVVMVTLLFCLLDMQFVYQQSEQLWLRILYDKNNKYDVYMSILKGTWKKTYNSTYNDVLAFVLFDKTGALTTQIPFTKVLSLRQKLLLDHFPNLAYIEEEKWVKGEKTSVMILRKQHSYTYKNAE